MPAFCAARFSPVPNELVPSMPTQLTSPNAEQEVERVVVSRRSSGELAVAEVASQLVDRGDVDGVGVGVDAADDAAGWIDGHCHDEDAFRVESDGRRRSGEQTGH